MGLDASVICNCYQQGLVEFPQEFQGLFTIDDDLYPYLDLLYEGNEELHHQFDLWLRNACIHEDMDYWCGQISNWRVVQEFYSLLKIQSPKFPTILREIPDFNGGFTEPQAAQEMLNELITLNKIEAMGFKHCLVDSKTNQEIWNWIEGLDSRWILNGSERINIGIDHLGFFIQANSDEDYLFRSNSFEQTLVTETDNGKHDALVMYRDLLTNKTFTCRSGIVTLTIQDNDAHEKYEHPHLFHTEWRSRKPQEYQQIIKSLANVCQASITTANPIRWG